MRMAVEVAQRETRKLGLDLATQPVHGPLCDAGHEVLLQPAEDGGEEVDDRGEQQDLRELREVHARARHDVRP